MNHKEVLTVAFRIIGLWAAVQGVSGLPFSLVGALHLFGVRVLGYELFQTHSFGALSPYYFQPVIYCLAATFLLFYAPRLAAYFEELDGARPEPEPDITAGATETDWLRIGTKLLGIYCVLQTVPVLAQTAVWIGSIDSRASMRPSGAGFLQGALFLALAVFLIVGARRIAEGITYLRKYPHIDRGDDEQLT